MKFTDNSRGSERNARIELMNSTAGFEVFKPEDNALGINLLAIRRSEKVFAMSEYSARILSQTINKTETVRESG